MDEQNASNQQDHDQSTSKLICTANHGFAPYAQEELRRRFGSVKSTMLIPGEVFVVTLESTIEAAVDSLKDNPLIFLRHIFPVLMELPGNDPDEALNQAAACLLKRDDLEGRRISVQVRKAEGSSWTESPGLLRDRLQTELSPLEADFTVTEPEWVISLFAAKNAWYFGVSDPSSNLSDWNGGAIRFQREEGQISRAKFKLLEAERQFEIPFSSFHNALDIGAAPGGWTSFLLERGLKVTAVDPAKMHESLLDHPNLRIVNKNASDVKFKEAQFDLLVCDMSWSPKLMARLVTDLLYALAPGGTAVVTVKLLTKKPMALVHEIMDIFEDSRMQIQGAKQLFHNRDEITLYMIKY
ncbi:SAM-dependent methyltransferase [Paenibacillus dakarensis]|uniref:SAM-dependent methyltransferase n=1 Tax=Paenibacillus dakarensis TaxID=1527293 RepID=UPI0006D53413|nr:SAM-dependent methyltransferase [Paenibacillus dakarensis]